MPTDMQFANFELKQRERQLIGPAGTVELSSRSFDILLALLSRPNELIGKSDLFDAAWPGVVVEENTLQVHVSSLRKLLGPGFITTVHGRGYKYVGPMPQAGAATQAKAIIDANKGNVPDYRPECVAREDELAAVAVLLERHRMVSIVGPGGVGKTTLAIEVAAQQQVRFKGGVWIVDLAPVSDLGHVAGSVVQTLGIQFQKSISASEALAEHLRTEELLLVVDNCEHLLGSVRDVLGVALSRAPRVKVLATSQIPLGLADEHVHKLAPFGLSQNGKDKNESPSSLFFRHCYESQGESITEAETDAVSRLCRSLDGMALALKMAAARSAVLGIDNVERQIKSEMSELTSSWPTSLPRHRSLMAALTWSYGLLGEAERKAFRALSVFSGSFSLEAAHAVAGEGESLPELVRKSLVARDGSNKSHYRLLETSRQFALDQLTLHDEVDSTRTRHSIYLTNLLRTSLDDWEKLPDRQWLEIYGSNIENLRSALEWLQVKSLWQNYAELAAYSYRLWLEVGLSQEGRAHCERALNDEKKKSLSNAIEADLRLAMSELCRAEAMDQLSVDVIEPAIQFYRENSDAQKLAQALVLKGFVHLAPERLDLARIAIAEVEELTRGLETSKLKAFALAVIGMNQWLSGEKQQGLAKCDAGLAMHRTTGNTRSGLKSALYIAETLHWGGDSPKAIAIGTGLLPDLRRAGFKRELGMQLHNLASYYLHANAVDQAREMHLESIEYFARDYSSWHWCMLQCAAGIEAITGDARRAARLMGFVDRGFDEFPEARQTTEDMERAHIFEVLEAALPPDELASLLKEGESLSAFEADHLANFPLQEVNRKD
jgi:predicted ATPase/DNA-binding winged helix-turn-helix (wHTH) protein